MKNMKNDDLLIPLVRDEQYNWTIFKRDVKILTDKYKHEDNTYVMFRNNLFGPVGLTFKNGKASAILTSTERFENDQERSIWLKKNRPLIYCIYDQRNVVQYDMETFEPIEPAKIQHTYFVRYFSHAGKLSWLKYNLQFLIGKYNFKHIRPFLYRYLVMD